MENITITDDMIDTLMGNIADLFLDDEIDDDVLEKIYEAIKDFPATRFYLEVE